MRKELTVLITCLFMLCISLKVNAASRLMDEADLLTASEETRVLQALDRVSDEYGLDIAIATILSTGSKSVEAYADDLFDESYTEGAMLLISMDDREWYITTKGEGISAFTDKGISLIGDEISPYLSDGEYAAAFLEFTDMAEEYIGLERQGKAVDVGSIPRGEYPGLRYLIMALAIGIPGGFIYAYSLKNQLKTVKKNNRASAYIKEGSLKVTESRDSFLYMHISKIPKPKASEAGGGSHTHMSSSGSSHGGGGGHF